MYGLFKRKTVGLGLATKTDLKPNLKSRPMKIDIRSAESVFITINGITYYIDDSTGEQIVEVYKEESKLLKTAQPIKD